MNTDGIDRDIILAQSGDRAAFARAVEAVYDDLAAFTAMRVPDRECLDEVIQETLIAAWASLATYRPEGTFPLWIKGVARHRALRLARHRRRKAGLPPGDDLVAPEAEPEDPRIDRLRACLERMPDQARALLQTRYEEGCPLDSMAVRLRCTADALAMRLSRLRQALRICMGQAEAP